jgi:hypothetical protein
MAHTTTPPANDPLAPEPAALQALLQHLEGAPGQRRAANAVASLTSRRAYVQGARAGRLAGFVWGFLAGCGTVALALQLGLKAGA